MAFSIVPESQLHIVFRRTNRDGTFGVSYQMVHSEDNGFSFTIRDISSTIVIGNNFSVFLNDDLLPAHSFLVHMNDVRASTKDECLFLEAFRSFSEKNACNSVQYYKTMENFIRNFKYTL